MTPAPGNAPTPIRIQRKRKRGWSMPANTVYVGRPTIWGNPYRDVSDLRGPFMTAVRIALGECAASSKAQAVELYRQWIMRPEQHHLRQRVISELRGKNLACWCSAGPCHADVLLEIANGNG